MNKRIIIALVAIVFYSCELKLPEEPEAPAWYLPITIPLIDTEYGFEGILQDGIITTTAEPYEDCGIDNNCASVDEDGSQGNGLYDLGEIFTDENGNGIWDEYGLTDSLNNMIQIEFESNFDSIGLSIVEQQLGLNFFKLDLSDIAIDPQVIQSEMTYDLSENLPSPLVDPTVIPVEIDIPDSENPLINTILESCSDFIPDNEQNLSIPVDLSSVPDPIALATQEISEPIVVEVPLDIDMDAIDLGDLGEITVEKIILSDEMEWEVEFRNGLPFIIQSLNFNIYKGEIENDDKLTSLSIDDILPYTTVTDYVLFDSYELTLDASLFAEIEIIVDSDEAPQEQCDLNICISDGISIDDESGEVLVDENNFTIYDNINDCNTGCDPCLGENLFVCVADAVDASGNIVGDPTLYQGESAEFDCTSSCDPCLDFTVAVCIADAVDASGNIVGDPTSYQGEDAQASCEGSCSPCLDLTTSVCVADAVDASGNIVGDPTSYQGENSQAICEAACAPCLQQVTYVCPIDSNIYDEEVDCNDNCAIACVSVDAFACLTDALDGDGNVDVNLIQTYATSGECLAACDPCFIEPIHACTTDALDGDGNVDANLIQTYATSGECLAACDPCFIEPIHACTTDAVDDDGNVLDDDLDGDGIPDGITIYNTEGECVTACDPCFNGSIYVCTTDSSVIDGDGNDLVQYSSEAECIASGCASCLEESLNGWSIQDDEITFNLNGDLILDTLVINLEINETPEVEPILIDFPSFDQIEVREALIDDGTQFDDFGLDGQEDTNDEGEGDSVNQEYEILYSNEFILNVNNGFFGDAELELNFSNIYDGETSYSESIVIESQSSSSDTFNLSNKRIGDRDLGINLESIEIDYDFSIQDGQYRIPLTDNILSIDETGYSAEVSNIKLKSISAITEEIDFPQVQSVPMQDLPAGFEGFEIYDIFMDMNIYNQITINTVNATFNLTGKKCPSGMDTSTCFDDDTIESKNFPFNIALDSPNRTEENVCGYQVGDIATTRISINKDSQITRYFCSMDDVEPYDIVEEPFDGENNVNLLDFIYFGPNQMNMVGGVLIDGEGTLRENDNLWGDFSIRAPLAFVFNEDWVFIPQDISIIDAMDESLSEQISNSLVEADFNAEFTNGSPFGISMSMLVSDSTLFPLYLDNLGDISPRCSNNQYLDQATCEGSEYTWLNYSDSLSDIGVNSVSFQQINNNDDRAYYVEFMGQDMNGEDSLLFWVGRIIDVSFIEPQEVDDNGFVVIPSISFSTEVLDATRVSWFTANEQRYMVPMITLASTEGNPSALQTTNYLGVRSFLTLILDTGGISNRSDRIILHQQNQPNSVK